MKTAQPVVETRKVVRALRELGFQSTNKGHKHGHVYQRQDKITARPNTQRREMTHQAMFQLGNELEGKRVCTRIEFIAMVKGNGQRKITLAPSTIPDKVQPVPEHVRAVRAREWDLDQLDEEVPVETATRRKRTTKRIEAGPAAVQLTEASFEVIRLSMFEVRVKHPDDEIEVIGQYASKKDAMSALTEYLMEQS